MKRLWHEIVWIWLVALTFGVVAIAWKSWAKPGSERFGTITVERIDVVEPDGRPRLVLSRRA